MINESMYSTGTEHWSTPDWLFAKINSVYKFTLDGCADTTNYKVKKYYNKAQNGLSKDWSGDITWVNPPYGRNISDWVLKATNEAKNGSTVVMLLPARTDTKWFQDLVFGGANIICFLRGRLKFSNSKTSAPFPSVIAVFSNSGQTDEAISCLSELGSLIYGGGNGWEKE